MYWVGENRPFMTIAHLSMVKQRLGMYASHMVFSTTSRRGLILKRPSYPRSPRTGSDSLSHSWRYWTQDLTWLLVVGPCVPHYACTVGPRLRDLVSEALALVLAHSQGLCWS
ncbi:hypothetical protein INR49_022939 [Caranx melampygus]|nr:hypothetical protein INR49_022939 [Caranx melampygus]